MPSLAAAAAGSIMRLKPGADKGAPRSETNTNGDLALSLWCLRNSRSSRPVSGWVLGMPFLTLRTCRDAVLKSICSHRRSTTSRDHRDDAFGIATECSGRPVKWKSLRRSAPPSRYRRGDVPWNQGNGRAPLARGIIRYNRLRNWGGTV
jgi:hypothetical protein